MPIFSPKFKPGTMCMSDVPCVYSYPERKAVWFNGDSCKPGIGPQMFLILGDITSLGLQHPYEYVIHEVVYVALWNEQKIFVPEKWLQSVALPKDGVVK